MAKFHDEISDVHQKFISEQRIFFVSSSLLDEDSHVNLSPKGLDSFRVLSPNRVGYMDLISSGNETSAHMLDNGRVTIMFCSFEGPPNILRLYGTGSTVLPDQPEWEELAPNFEIHPSTRQLIVANISLVQTSCGFGVPLYEYKGERDVHFKWAEELGETGLNAYRNKHNLKSLDGLPSALGMNQGS